MNHRVALAGTSTFWLRPTGCCTLVGWQITNDSVPSLLRYSNLTALDLAETSLTDAVVPTLSTLAKLEELNLTETGLTAAGIAQLRTALPECRIYWVAAGPDNESP